MVNKGNTKMIRRRKARSTRKGQVKTMKRIKEVIDFLRTPLEQKGDV